MRIRIATAGDKRFIEDMLVEAARWDSSRPDESRDDTLREPANLHYVEGWPRDTDVGVVAEDGSGERLGAAWYRFFSMGDPGYGFVSEDIPEVSIGVVHEVRGRGIGDRLLTELEKVAKRHRLRALSLSVETENRAVNLYRRHGYGEVGQSAGSLTMVLPLRLGALDEAVRAIEVREFLARATAWAKERTDIRAVALVGSWARLTAQLDSDVDLVVLTVTPDVYTGDDAWAEGLGATKVARTADWGAITERRLVLRSGLEVEVDVGTPAWAATDPVDEGSRRVITDGMRILYDPVGLLASLVNACEGRPISGGANEVVG